ncbi:MAG TPA: aldo/keto reductase [Candidatus Limnocylindrales bacterium]|jgi:aryl-alcohol dehydrogenase-like predicted oxidoreductase
MGLGTNRLTDTPGHEAFLRDAAMAGIGLVDTAHLYTGGNSERTIGSALATMPLDRRPVVATKGGYGAGENRPEVLRGQIEQSLRSLQVDTIDLYYLHRAHPDTPLEDSLGEIRRWVDRGAIRLVGLSQVGIEQIDQGRTVVPIAAVQNHYNLGERRWDAVIDHCHREGIVFVPFFPLRDMGGGVAERIAAHQGLAPSQVALAWLLRRSPAVLPIPGTLSGAHLRENLATLDLDLDAEVIGQLS